MEACDATANVDPRYGLSTRWTVFAGGDRFWRDTIPDLVHPYAGVLGSLGNAIGLEGEAVGDAVLRGAIRIEPSVNFLVMAEASRYDTDVVEPLLTVSGRRSQYTIFAQAWPFPGRLRNWLGFDANLDWTESLQDRRTSGRLAASLQPGNARFIAFVRWTRTEVTGGGTNEDTRFGLNLFQHRSGEKNHRQLWRKLLCIQPVLGGDGDPKSSHQTQLAQAGIGASAGRNADFW